MNVRMVAAAAALCGLLVLPGCASTGSMSEAQKLAVYEDAAGEPVSSFSYLGRISGWTPIDDTNIAVWTRPREAWLLTFAGRCQDIDFTPVISLTSQASRVYAGFDKVMVHNRSSIQMPCRIREIRELDTARIKAAEKTARDEAQASPSGT
ncbi:DUF6491 family protein [Luteimonas terricola]|uniref:Lipoprotein n=1 Tax=Luteimonas terricola TaxID=645597 RepID=A0ABQ2EDC9_9GAMM|nr:DUF6491 family protein [Luteimonas terricola]GGK07721.1 hypothetical protein GCM10011394_16150 [Luteimonas terricola]